MIVEINPNIIAMANSNKAFSLLILALDKSDFLINKKTVKDINIAMDRVEFMFIKDVCSTINPLVLVGKIINRDTRNINPIINTADVKIGLFIKFLKDFILIPHVFYNTNYFY